jgi:hypothetical protein
MVVIVTLFNLKFVLFYFNTKKKHIFLYFSYFPLIIIRNDINFRQLLSVFIEFLELYHILSIRLNNIHTILNYNSFLLIQLVSSTVADPSRLKTAGSKSKGPALYFDKLSQNQEILMKSSSLERRKSALKLDLF